jgi:rare lipoprotein A
MQRIFAAASLTALTLAVLGCHREKVAYRQPPPPPAPVYRTAPTVRANSRTSNPQVAAGTETSAGTDRTNLAETPAERELGKPVETEIGLASWYGTPYDQRKTSDGTVYDQNGLTAAHLTLPFGTMVRVTNVSTGQSVVVRINDRGPFVKGRIIDLSLGAAKAIGIYRVGVGKVKVEAFAPPQRAGVDPAGRWCVQIGAFATEAEAQRLQRDLLRRYATAKVIQFQGPTGHWVRITPAQPDREHTSAIANNIHPSSPQAEPYLTRMN